MGRGTKFKDRFKSFYETMIERKYRVPGFLATSGKKAIAAGFGYNKKNTQPYAMWHVVFDLRGELQPKFRVKHMTFVSKTLIPGEGEYLFAPYSVFAVVSLRWSDNLNEPHSLTIMP